MWSDIMVAQVPTGPWIRNRPSSSSVLNRKKAASTSNIWPVLPSCCGNNSPVSFVCTASFYIKETLSFTGQSQHTGSSAWQHVADKITERLGSYPPSSSNRRRMASLVLWHGSVCVYCFNRGRQCRIRGIFRQAVPEYQHVDTDLKTGLRKKNN
ncbi:hypothetical protein ILYODFUR_019932, partial [Ilyodon furcidens]